MSNFPWLCNKLPEGKSFSTVFSWFPVNDRIHRGFPVNCPFNQGWSRPFGNWLCQVHHMTTGDDCASNDPEKSKQKNWSTFGIIIPGSFMFLIHWKIRVFRFLSIIPLQDRSFRILSAPRRRKASTWDTWEIVHRSLEWTPDPSLPRVQGPGSSSKLGSQSWPMWNTPGPLGLRFLFISA